MIKVFIIDDSMLIRNSIIKILKDENEIEVLGEASNPIDAMKKFQEIGLPDVILLDLEMPKMDGISFLKKIENERHIPTIVIASIPNKECDKAKEVLEIGAKAIIPKPKTLESKNFINDLLDSIKKSVSKDDDIKKKFSKNKTSNKVVAIGASTGGVQTLEKILKDLKPFHAPILITQHMPKGFTKSFASRLDKICKNSKVKEIDSSEIVKAGEIYIAPGNYHLELEKTKNNKFMAVLKDYPKVSNHKPSVDVLFTSFAKEAKENAIAFILTGMGKDGALGIAKIKNAGGKTYAQDKESSVVYGMPKVAFELGGVHEQVTLKEVSDIINNIK